MPSFPSSTCARRRNPPPPLDRPSETPPSHANALLPRRAWRPTCGGRLRRRDPASAGPSTASPSSRSAFGRRIPSCGPSARALVLSPSTWRCSSTECSTSPQRPSSGSSCFSATTCVVASCPNYVPAARPHTWPSTPGDRLRVERAPATLGVMTLLLMVLTTAARGIALRCECRRPAHYTATVACTANLRRGGLLASRLYRWESTPPTMPQGACRSGCAVQARSRTSAPVPSGRRRTGIGALATPAPCSHVTIVRYHACVYDSVIVARCGSLARLRTFYARTRTFFSLLQPRSRRVRYATPNTGRLSRVSPE